MVIINLIPSVTISISYTAVQQTCSYKVLFTDTTTISDPVFDRGLVEYFLRDSQGNYNKIGETRKGSQFIYDFCSPGIYNIRQMLTIREIPNCGGLSPIIYQAYIDFQITVLDWQPEIVLPAFNSCLIRGIEQNIEFIHNFNNNVCGSLTPSIQIQILNKPSESRIVDANITGIWTVTFDKSGEYNIRVNITNCCTTISKLLNLFVCEPVQIITDCCDCDSISINNYSNIDISYSLDKLYPESEFQKVEGLIEAQKSAKVDITRDGIYEIKYIDIDNKEKSKIHYVFCRIDNCINNILKNILCSDDCCRDCPSEQKQRDRYRLNQIILLKELYFKNIAEEMIGKNYDLTVESSLIDYNNRISNLFEVDDIYNKLIEICDSCGNNTPNNCNCGCN